MHSTTGTATGLARQGWVIPGMAVVAIVGLLYLRFLLLLPRRIAIQFAIGGVIFVLGVVGIEILGSFFKESMAAENASCNLKGDCGFSYNLLVALEEGMEMLGITIFANALLGYASRLAPSLVCVSPVSARYALISRLRGTAVWGLTKLACCRRLGALRISLITSAGSPRSAEPCRPGKA